MCRLIRPLLEGRAVGRVVALALLVAFPAFAQTPDDLATAACRKYSVTAQASDPAKALQAQEAYFQKCMAESIPSGQRREIALHREKAAACNDEALTAQKVDAQVTNAMRDQIYANCMAPRYIVQ